MDIQRFEQLVRDPGKTREDLENMKKNALAKGKPDFASIADEVLLQRFPEKGRRSGGATPTTGTFRGRNNEFASGKDAYLWLVEQFCRYRSGTLDKYVALHTKAGARSKGRRFAANESDLFPKGSRRQGDPTFYSKVSNGWFADTNLSHADKFATLMQLSYVCGLEYEVDWNFRVTGATEQLLEHQQSVVGARKALAELLADLDK
jgi:hypothetical protein